MCLSCAQKQQQAGYQFAMARPTFSLSPSSEGCLYSFEQLVEKRNELELVEPIFRTATQSIHISYLQSAINYYSKNCNLFNSQLALVFQ